MNESNERRPFAARAVRSIEAAAIAGLAHSFLALIATAMLLASPDPADGDAAVGDYFNDDGNQVRALTAVNLLAISSIAFLWFVAVIRRRVGDRENRFFGTVFFGSGLLLAGSWLVAGVLLATPALATRRFEVAPDAGTVAVLQSAGLTMASVIATRLEAVFMISTTTVGRLSEAFPRWLVVVGYVVGLTLLLVPVPNSFATYLFPLWVAVVSATMLVRRDEIRRHAG